MDEQRLDDQLELIYNSSVPIQDVTWKTIETGGERGSWKFVVAARHDDDSNRYWRRKTLNLNL